MRENAERFLECLHQVVVPPYSILERLMNYECRFVKTHHPTEKTSFMNPPILLGDRVETIPIDGVLGVYTLTTQQITIYHKGIQRVSKFLKEREEDVTYVTRLHEWAHALIHVGLLKDDGERMIGDDSVWNSHLDEATTLYKEISPELHERLAQLLVFHGLQSVHEEATLPEAKAAIERIAKTFETLTRHAPQEYKISDYVGIQKHRIVQSIILLKRRSLRGAEAWDTVIRW